MGKKPVLCQRRSLVLPIMEASAIRQLRCMLAKTTHKTTLRLELCPYDGKARPLLARVVKVACLLHDALVTINSC